MNKLAFIYLSLCCCICSCMDPDMTYLSTESSNSYASYDITASESDDTAFKIYMNPDGNDDNDGLSSSSPILTLEEVQAILIDINPDSNIEIHIEPGNYYDQQVVWQYTNGHNITFTSSDFGTERPVFDGRGNKLWFNLKVRGQYTNLHFRYLQIQNYHDGIYLYGNRNDIESGWNGNNSFYGIYFKNIGSKYSNYPDQMAYAAIYMPNSQENSITNCHFVNIENKTEDQFSYIHAIYILHYASNNSILRNRFKTVSGDPVRTRDESNYNVINENRFINTGKYGYYSDFYCFQGCTKESGECPSIGNQFKYNECNQNYYGETGSLYYLEERENEHECDALDTYRLITYQNVLN